MYEFAIECYCSIRSDPLGVKVIQTRILIPSTKKQENGIKYIKNKPMINEIISNITLLNGSTFLNRLACSGLSFISTVKRTANENPHRA